MTRDEKSKIVAELGEAFKASEAIVISDFKGLSVKQLEDLRNSAREAGVKVRVIKNTLANIALKNAEKNGFEWDNIQLLRNGIYKIQGMDRYIHIIKNGFVIKDGNGNIIDYLDRKLNKLP